LEAAALVAAASGIMFVSVMVDAVEVAIAGVVEVVVVAVMVDEVVIGPYGDSVVVGDWIR